MECQEQRRLIEEYWLPELDSASHVFIHDDLSANNIMINKSFEVKR